MKIINIVAGGPFERIPPLRRNNQCEEVWIAVDRGLEHLRYFDITPDFVIGDFDSTKLQREEIESYKNCLIFPTEKDFTDLELALTRAIKLSPTTIRIYGATGGRLDHEMVNLQLLLKSLEKGIYTQIIDVQNKVFLRYPGSYIMTECNYKYVSFISVFSEVSELTLTGFKYPLTNETLRFGSTLCISNETNLETSTYSFSSGILMIIESND